MKIYVCILITCLFGGLLLSDTSFASICDEKETVVFFGNGVKTLEDDAYDSQNIIKDELEKYLPPEEFELLGFDLAYNDTHTLPLDLLESSVQILTGNISGFWRFFWKLAPVPDWFAEKFILLSSVLDYSALLTTDSLAKHVSSYKTAISEGKKIILVAHSQGNLFGNQAYKILSTSEKRSFGMVSVANADNNVLGNYTEQAVYTTLIDDRAILKLIDLQLHLPTSPMSPNTENLTVSEDPWGHSFIDSYMVEGSVSETQITGDIITALGSLYTPYQLVEPGVITVSLTWGPAPDIDLHVYEPSGTHVYWINMQGISGSLDRDDRSHYGPEHYHVPSCDTLERGLYEIALDYFEGDYPEIATVQIEAGLLSRTFEIPMSSEDYGSSYWPVQIADIRVMNNESGGYEFEIYE